MKLRILFVAPLVVAFLTLGFLVGCGGEQQTDTDKSDIAQKTDGGDEIDPHDVPITEEQREQLRQETAQFPDAVAKVKSLRDTVESETRDGTPEDPFDVHQALDKADIVVQWLPEIARDSGVTKEHWETVNTTANELRELFEKIHQNIDSQSDPDFASVKQDMDAKIAALEAIAQ